MASGKKGKKTKGKTLALTDFLQETTGSIPVQPIRKSNINWADEVEDYDGYDTRKPVNVVLPTAPKASRDYEDISDKVPKEPPYIAYLSNLPYDIDEDEIASFFKNMKIVNMRIPKDERAGEATKARGFGYVEFEDRESLLNALVIRDTTIKSRRIRIEVAANSENDNRRRARMDIGRDRVDRNEFSGDWRSGPRIETADNDRRSGYNRDRNGGFNRGSDREERSFSRDNMRSGDRDDRGSFTRDNMRDRDGAFNRDRDNRDSYSYNRKDREGQDDRSSSWRDGDRTNRDQDRDRGYARDRGNFRESDRGSRFDDREERRGFSGRRFDSDRDRNGGGFTRGGRDERESEPASSEPRERPKLMLAPRTKPVENVPVKSETVPSASIFGSAKPVDTSQREREIEEKLAKEHLEEKQTDTSKDRKTQPSEDNERKNPEKNKSTRRVEDSPNKESPPPRRNYDDKKAAPRTEYKSPDKTDSKHKTDKSKKEERRDRHDKEMPKLAEPEPPNFAANNKFAFLQTEDNSD